MTPPLSNTDERTGVNVDRIRQRLESAHDTIAALREAAPELCENFGAERLTVYLFDATREKLKAIVQLGLDSTGDQHQLTIPADPRLSVAGYAAGYARAVNIHDAYDDAELGRFDPPVAFLRAIDERTGYRTSQLLAARIPAAAGAPIGVVQFINRVGGGAFPESCEQGIIALAALIGKVMGTRSYDGLPTGA